MLDERDLQAIADLMDKKIGESEQRMTAKIQASQDQMTTKIQESQDQMMTKLQASQDQMMAKLQASQDQMMAKLQASQDQMTANIQASQDQMMAYTNEKVKDARNQVMAYIEAAVMPQFKVLAEGHELLLQTLAPKNRVEVLEEDVSMLKMLVKALGEQVQEMKKAQ